eukprot:15197237-Heterocapsa_arctica.AAC.1
MEAAGMLGLGPAGSAGWTWATGGEAASSRLWLVCRTLSRAAGRRAAGRTVRPGFRTGPGGRVRREADVANQ